MLNLRRDKVILSFFIVFGLWLSGNELFAQRSHRWSGHVDMNLVNYDKRKIHYGFLIGVQASRFKVNLGEGYDAPAFSDVLNIEATQNYGFSTGFIFNLKVADFFDFRLTPKVDFNEYGLQYTFRNGVKYKDLGFKAEDDLVETVMISLPVLVRYVSQRRGNYRMYMIAGVAPSVEVSGKKKKDIILEANKY
ncbi:MAG: PorT family protein, partial [Cytophagales bacterium]|nr:PorT family protein [Cytophagales bacterium]